MVREEALPNGVGEFIQESLLVKGVGSTTVFPRSKVMLNMVGTVRVVHVAVTKHMPVKRFELLLGNDLGGGLMGTLWGLQNGGRDNGDMDKIVESECEEKREEQ